MLLRTQKVICKVLVHGVKTLIVFLGGLISTNKTSKHSRGTSKQVHELSKHYVCFLDGLTSNDKT